MQYPIWLKIKSCIYKTPKSYGIRNDGFTSVRVGTSSTNSHKFIDFEIKHHLMDNGEHVYEFYVNLNPEHPTKHAKFNQTLLFKRVIFDKKHNLIQKEINVITDTGNLLVLRPLNIDKLSTQEK